MSSASLQELNRFLFRNSQPFGTFTISNLLSRRHRSSTNLCLGIVPDNDYVPDSTGKLLKQGHFDKTLSVITGHNQDEGSRFVQNSEITNDTYYASYLESLITPLAEDPDTLAFITRSLYPPVFDGSQGYTNQAQRNNLTVAHAEFVCNTLFMNQASFFHPTYAYQFSVPPAIHGADLTFTFYDFDPSPGVNTTVAKIMQYYIARFAQTGQPNAPGLP